MKLIIAGGRDFGDLGLVYHWADLFKYHYDLECVVSGKAKGADRLGETWAEENDIPVKAFPADWKQFGKSAGPIRNNDMADYATALLAFWDMESKGTQHMIQAMLTREKEVVIIPYVT